MFLPDQTSKFPLTAPSRTPGEIICTWAELCSGARKWLFSAPSEDCPFWITWFFILSPRCSPCSGLNAESGPSAGPAHFVHDVFSLTVRALCFYIYINPFSRIAAAEWRRLCSTTPSVCSSLNGKQLVCSRGPAGLMSPGPQP